MSEHLGDLWLRLVEQSPTGTALIEGDNGRVWSRADLAKSVTEWRETFGAPLRGRFVTFAEKNRPEWFRVFIGLMQVGAIPVPLDPADPFPARQSLARSIGAAAMWENGHLEQLPGRFAARSRDYCLVKLTSGSTGVPRALVFTHGQIIADGRQICSTMRIGPDDLNLGIIPFGHSYGIGNLVAPLLTQGTPIVCAASPLPRVLAAESARWKPTVFPAVPTLLRALVNAELEPASLANLRLIISAGAPLPADVAQAFSQHFGKRIHSFYGSSETGGITYDQTGEAALTSRSVGTPMDGVRLTFTRGSRFRVASPAVMKPGHHSPSDLAQLNAFGELVLIGRSGRTAKIAGRRLNLAEIEEALRAVPGVTDAYATVHPDKPDALAAAVSTQIDAREIRRILSLRVAVWKIPERFIVLPELPRTSRGKIDRRKVEALLARSK